MKMICFVLSTLCLSGVVQAQSMLHQMPVSSEIDARIAVDTSAPGDANYFDTLLGWVAQSRPLSFQEMKGYYSGRCFLSNDKNKALASMLGYYERTVNGDPGPGLPSKREVRLGGLGWSGSPSDAFDKDEDFIRNKADLKNAIIESWGKISEIEESPSLGYTFDWEPNRRPDEKHEFTMYGDYILEKWTALVRQRYGKGLGLKNPGDVLAMCYYFKKLGN